MELDQVCEQKEKKSVFARVHTCVCVCVCVCVYVCVCVCVCVYERERERERQTDRQTDRQRQRERERESFRAYTQRGANNNRLIYHLSTLLLSTTSPIHLRHHDVVFSVDYRGIQVSAAWFPSQPDQHSLILKIKQFASSIKQNKTVFY